MSCDFLRMLTGPGPRNSSSVTRRTSWEVRLGTRLTVLYCMLTLLYTKGAAKKEDKAWERGYCIILYAYIVIYKRSSKERRQGLGKRLLYYTVCLHCYIQKEQQRKKTRPGEKGYCTILYAYIVIYKRSSKERSQPGKEAAVLYCMFTSLTLLYTSQRPSFTIPSSTS